MAANNKPTHRIIAKQTDARNERFENVGVAWQKENEDGRPVVSLKFNRFCNVAALADAASILLVPNDDDRRRGREPGDDDGDPGPDDRDYPGAGPQRERGRNDRRGH